jgi:hypothetical protein
VPSLPTLHRALHRDLDPGERAGLAAGERAARKHDVFLARPRGRNQVWETDHVQVPVLVDVEGTARRPWITWFTDCATNAITGLAVTPGYPSRESVLAALRAAVLREDPYGPCGGLPETPARPGMRPRTKSCWTSRAAPGPMPRDARRVRLSARAGPAGGLYVFRQVAGGHGVAASGWRGS